MNIKEDKNAKIRDLTKYFDKNYPLYKGNDFKVDTSQDVYAFIWSAPGAMGLGGKYLAFYNNGDVQAVDLYEISNGCDINISKYFDFIPGFPGKNPMKTKSGKYWIDYGMGWLIYCAEDIVDKLMDCKNIVETPIIIVKSLLDMIEDT